MKLETRDYVWIIGILTVAVIIQASLKIEHDDNLALLVGVATGIVSMVIGILAIFYSLTSSGTLSETSNRLHDASVEIGESVDTITSKLKEISAEIAPLARVAQQVSEIHAKLPLGPQGNQASTSSPPQPSGQNFDAEQFANEWINYFLATSSWIGLLTLYAAIERHRASKSFNAYTWANMVGGISPDYATGYLVCTTSLGLITHDVPRFMREGNFTITFVFPLLNDRLLQSVTANLTRSDITAENSALRSQQKALTDTYISQP
jgi:hypothetical protein